MWIGGRSKLFGEWGGIHLQSHVTAPDKAAAGDGARLARHRQLQGMTQEALVKIN